MLFSLLLDLGQPTSRDVGCLPNRPEQSDKSPCAKTMCCVSVVGHCHLSCKHHKNKSYIVGDCAYGIQIPSASGDSAPQRVRPDWSIVLAYGFKLRKEAMKKVLAGHTLAESLEAVIRDHDLNEAYFTTPTTLRVSMPESQPNKFVRHN